MSQTKKIDKSGPILILDVVYNSNTQTEQVTTLLDLLKILETIKDFSDKHVILAGDFNFFFDTSLDSYRGKPTLKKNLWPNLSNLKKSLICVTFGE